MSMQLSMSGALPFALPVGAQPGLPMISGGGLYGIDPNTPAADSSGVNNLLALAGGVGVNINMSSPSVAMPFMQQGVAFSGVGMSNGATGIANGNFGAYAMSGSFGAIGSMFPNLAGLDQINASVAQMTQGLDTLTGTGGCGCSQQDPTQDGGAEPNQVEQMLAVIIEMLTQFLDKLGAADDTAADNSDADDLIEEETTTDTIALGADFSDESVEWASA